MLSTPRFVGAAVAARRAAAVCRVSPRTRRIAPALAPAASAARSFTATPRACFKSDAANDDPGNFFEFAFSKRDGSKSAPSSTTTTTTRPAAAAPPSAAPFTPEANKLADNFGFLFDCDGVLHLGNQQIKGAREALRLCHHQATRYLFLTNGGGNTTEEQKAVSLRKKVGLATGELVDGRVIQSHTPLGTFNEESKRNDTIYVTSLDPKRAREICHAYGFKNVVTAADLVHHYRDIFPFEPKMIDDQSADAQPLPHGAKLWKPSSPAGQPTEYDEAELQRGNYLKIDHIFALNDPRDWALEVQILHDLLVSHGGYLGTVSRANGTSGTCNDGWQQDGQPTVWVSNLDLLWKTENPISRFGTGAFVHALRGVWQVAAGGRELQFKYMGKPSQITYEYAHQSLLKSPSPRDGEKHVLGGGQRPLRRVYMVGDNPESDVRGALEFHPEDGTEYVPILVRTGVWQETKAQPDPRFRPAVIVDDVLDAVVWAMAQEGIAIDRAMVEEGRAGTKLLDH